MFFLKHGVHAYCSCDVYTLRHTHNSNNNSKRFCAGNNWSRHVVIVGLFAHKILFTYLLIYLLAHTHTRHHVSSHVNICLYQSVTSQKVLYGLCRQIFLIPVSHFLIHLFFTRQFSILHSHKCTDLLTYLLTYRFKTQRQAAATHWTLGEYSQPFLFPKSYSYLLSVTYCNNTNFC